MKLMALALAAFALALPLAAGAGEEAVVGVRERGYDLAFDPTEMTVAPGATVTFRTDGQFAHTLTAADGAFDTGNVAPGGEGTFAAPSQAGEYAFVCSYHEQMRGTLVVAGAAAPSPEDPAEPAAESRETPLFGPVAAAAALALAVALLARRR